MLPGMEGGRSVEALTFHPPHLCLSVFGSALPSALPLLRLGQGKGQWKHNPFTHRSCACAFLEALCQVLCQCSALGARTGRALQNGLHTERLQTICRAIGEGPSRGPRQRINNGFTRRHPLSEGSSPLAPHWLCLWVVRSSFAVRAPCAHQRQGNASHKAKRFQRRAGHRRGARKALRFAHTFLAPKAGECFA